MIDTSHKGFQDFKQDSRYMYVYTLSIRSKKTVEIKVAQTPRLQVRKLKPREITLVYHDSKGQGSILSLLMVSIKISMKLTFITIKLPLNINIFYCK